MTGPESENLEADVAAMLRRRAQDVDHVAQPGTPVAPVARLIATPRTLLIGAAAAACAILVAGLVALVTGGSEDDITNVVSQPDATVEAVPTPITVEGSILEAVAECEAAAAGQAVEAVCRTTETLHTVVEGDFLSRIAQTYGVTTSEILRANPTLDDEFNLGDELVIPPSVSTAPTTAVCPFEFPVARDTTGNGVVDTCYPDLGSAQDSTPDASDPEAEVVPANWQDNSLDGDPPAQLQLWTLAVNAQRYIALANQAENIGTAECMRGTSFPFEAIDMFAERPTGQPSFGFELAPFAANGSYVLPASHAQTDSTLGPDANSIMVEQRSYRNSLLTQDRVEYDRAFDDCVRQARIDVFGSDAGFEGFYELANTGTNLPFVVMSLVDSHLEAQRRFEVWRECMAEEGQAVHSRSQAILASFEERHAGGQRASDIAGPIELGYAAADRQCSAITGHNRSRSVALAAAERFLMAHDLEVQQFIESWAETVAVLRPRLEEIVGSDLVSEQIASGYVARGVPLDEYLSTKASFEEAFVAEVAYCAEQNGFDPDQARAFMNSGASGWWLNRTIAADRARIAREGGGPLSAMLGENSELDPAFDDVRQILEAGPIMVNPSSEEFSFGCIQWASQIVSPKQRAENEPGFNARYAQWIEPLGFREQLDQEWALCMGAAGYSEFERSADMHQASFDLVKRVNEGEMVLSEALAIDIEVFGAHFECMLTIDSSERFRLFSEETAAAFLAEQE